MIYLQVTFNIELDNPWEDDKYLLLPNEYSLEDDWLKSNNISIKELKDLKKKNGLKES